MKTFTGAFGVGKLTAMIGTAIGVVALCTVLAGPKGTNRPFKGSMTGEATFLFDWLDPECTCDTGVTVFTVAVGNLSHLGVSLLSASHCAPPLEGGGFVCTQLKLVAANGDELWATYDDEDGVPPFIVTFNGGTGRFSTATGSAAMDWGAQPMFNGDEFDFTVPWPWWTTLEGTLSY